MPFVSCYAPYICTAPRFLLCSITGGAAQVDVSALHWLLRIRVRFVALEGQIGHFLLLSCGFGGFPESFLVFLGAPVPFHLVLHLVAALIVAYLAQ